MTILPFGMVANTLMYLCVKKLFKSDRQESRYSQISLVAKVIRRNEESRITLATLSNRFGNSFGARTGGSAPLSERIFPKLLREVTFFAAANVIYI